MRPLGMLANNRGFIPITGVRKDCLILIGIGKTPFLLYNETIRNCVLYGNNEES